MLPFGRKKIMAKPKSKEVQRQRLFKWTSGIAWFCVLLSLVLNIMVNTGGLGTDANGINAESYSVISFTAPYDELQTPIRCAFTYFVYANAVCTKPTSFINKAITPYCFYEGLGNSFDLTQILQTAETELKSAVSLAFGGGKFPTETTKNVKLKPMEKLIPSIIYIVAGVCCFLALLFIPRGFGKVQWKFGRKRFNLFIAFAGFALLSAASALWTYKAFWIRERLSAGTNPKYIKDISIGTEFMGMTWLASVFMLVATVLMGVEYFMAKSVHKEQDVGRGDFKRLLDNEEGGDRRDSSYKGAVQMTVREQSPPVPAKLQMPGYEPLRA